MIVGSLGTAGIGVRSQWPPLLFIVLGTEPKPARHPPRAAIASYLHRALPSKLSSVDRLPSDAAGRAYSAKKRRAEPSARRTSSVSPSTVVAPIAWHRPQLLAEMVEEIVPAAEPRLTVAIHPLEALAIVLGPGAIFGRGAAQLLVGRAAPPHFVAPASLLAHQSLVLERREHERTFDAATSAVAACTSARRMPPPPFAKAR